MKRFVLTFVLTLILSSSALAGDVPTVGINSQGPNRTTQGPASLTPGEIPTVGYAQQFSDAALNLFQVMLGWSSI